LGADSCGPKKLRIRWGQGRTNPFTMQGVTRRRCGLSSKFFDQLLLLHTLVVLEPACRFNFHARKPECTVALHADDSRVWTVITTPGGSSNSRATADAHRAERSGIKTTSTAAVLN